MNIAGNLISYPIHLQKSRQKLSKYVKFKVIQNFTYKNTPEKMIHKFSVKRCLSRFKRDKILTSKLEVIKY